MDRNLGVSQVANSVCRKLTRVAIACLCKGNSGGTIASCTVVPTLPTGLSIDNTTCVISGTPTEVKAITAYTVIAANATGQTDTATVSLATSSTNHSQD
jgi:LmbE family N-acetylglucosaminyl deacetylase